MSRPSHTMSCTKTSSRFVDGALAHPSNTRGFGENGHAEVSSDELDDDVLYLFDKALRGIDFEELKRIMEGILCSPTRKKIIDLYLLAFQTRWSRGGNNAIRV